MKFNPLIPWKKEDRPLAGSRPSGDPLAMFHRRIDNMFDDLFGSHLPAAFGSGGEGFAPHIDLSETDKEVRITAELPGLDENDVEVTLADNVVTLKGEKKQETKEEKEDYYHSERSYGFFERSVQLPDAVDVEKAEARFKNGVLNIAIPKRPESAPARRKIELKTE